MTVSRGRSSQRRGDWYAWGDGRAGAKEAAAGGRPVTWLLEPVWAECVIGNLGRLQQSTDTIRLTVGTDVQNGGKSGTWQGRHDGEGGRGWVWDEAGLTSAWDVGHEKEQDAHHVFPDSRPFQATFSGFCPTPCLPGCSLHLFLQIPDCWGAPGLKHRRLSPRGSFLVSQLQYRSSLGQCPQTDTCSCTCSPGLKSCPANPGISPWRPHGRLKLETAKTELTLILRFHHLPGSSSQNPGCPVPSPPSERPPTALIPSA